MGRAKVNAVHRSVGRPDANRGFGSVRHGMVGVVIGPPISGAVLQEVQLLMGMVAFPISSVVGKEVAVPTDPNPVEGVADTAGP